MIDVHMSDPSTEKTIIVRSALGIFVLSTEDENIFTGAANGYSLELCLSFDNGNDRFSAILKKEEILTEAEDRRLSGEFVSFNGLSTYLASWIDEVCSEDIEAYADDVRYFQSSDGKIAYWAYNTHLNTTPIAFVHGGPGGDSNPVKARRLHLHNPIYLFDQMGCGLSDPIKDYDSWNIQEYVDEMKEFIDHIPADKVIIIGASWGSGLSVSYAVATSCKKIAAMILPSPFLSTKLWTQDMWQNLQTMGQDRVDIVKKAIEHNDFGPDFIEVLGEYNSKFLFNRTVFREYAFASAKEEPNETFRKLNGPNDMSTTGKLKDFDITAGLEKLNIPVLFMCSDSDEVTIPRIVEYHDRVKGSRLSIIPNAGHVLALEQFELYRDSIVAFLNELGL